MTPRDGRKRKSNSKPTVAAIKMREYHLAVHTYFCRRGPWELCNFVSVGQTYGVPSSTARPAAHFYLNVSCSMRFALSDPVMQAASFASLCVRVRGQEIYRRQ